MIKEYIFFIVILFSFSCGNVQNDAETNSNSEAQQELAEATNPKTEQTDTEPKVIVPKAVYSEDVVYFTEAKGTFLNKLVGRYHDYEQVLISSDDNICYSVVEQKDYNKDGYDELCVEIINGRGGNCCGNSLKIFSFNGEKFVSTDKYGWDWDGVEVRKENGKTVFIVETINAGYNADICQNKVETLVFEDFKLKVINVEEDEKVNAVLNFTSADYGAGFVEFDLDGDLIKDEISAEYWERWGVLTSVKIVFSNGDEFSFGDLQPKRVGVLNSKTKGHNDLVIDCDEIYKWNGNSYVAK